MYVCMYVCMYVRMIQYRSMWLQYIVVHLVTSSNRFDDVPHFLPQSAPSNIDIYMNTILHSQALLIAGKFYGVQIFLLSDTFKRICRGNMDGYSYVIKAAHLKPSMSYPGKDCKLIHQECVTSNLVF